MTNKKIYTWQDIEKMCVHITCEMYSDGWFPNYIVGVTRGGNVPATIIANMLSVPADSLSVSFRDNGLLTESNCAMAEDAFGYNVLPQEGYYLTGNGSDPDRRKNILIIDDINDTGRTFNWIMKDWQQSCMPEDPAWKDIWNNNVRFAALTENLSSEFEHVTYYCDTVNKAEEDVWLVYPWENVGIYDR